MDALGLPGNASSPHVLGERAARLIDDAARNIAAIIEVSPAEITFTSGATEANNIAIIGGAKAMATLFPHRRTIVVSAVEHKAVLEPALALREQGFEVRLAPVEPSGVVDTAQLEAMVDDNTAVVSVMAANNETGAIQPVAEVARIARKSGALVHSDLAQAYGKIPLEHVVAELDYASISAHKIYGPQGIGALIVAAGSLAPCPVSYGGGQQGARRPGTLPAALIAGFGAAAEVAKRRMLADGSRLNRLMNQMIELLQSHGLDVQRVGRGDGTIPGTAALRVTGVDADELCMALASRVCISTGSACNSGQITPSHVLNALGLRPHQVHEIFRVCIPRDLSDEDAEAAANSIAQAAARQIRTGRSVQA
jgi:cysteine desulfurase